MNDLEEKMTWKLKKNNEIEQKSHFGPLYLSTHKGYEKDYFIMRFSRYQSVIVASIGFAPQILQKLWASENGPTHYLDSLVKIWAIPPMPLTLLFSKTVRNSELKFFVQSSYTWRHTWGKFHQNLRWSPGDFLKIGSLEPEWPSNKKNKISVYPTLFTHYFIHFSQVKTSTIIKVFS